jgi:hypothetical protein
MALLEINNTPVKSKVERGKLSKDKKTITLKEKLEDTNSVLSLQDKMAIVFSFVYGKGTYQGLAEKYKVHYDTIRKLIRDFQNDLNNLAETYKLVDCGENKFSVTNHANLRRADPVLINEAFLSLLSHPNAPILTEKEQSYAWIYTFTGDNMKALKQSGLAEGLLLHGKLKESDGTPRLEPVSFQNAAKIRGFYLRSKDNIKEYIISLRERKLEDLKIDKGYIQSVLVDQIEALKEEVEDKSNRAQLLRSVELLGRTCNAFTETIRIEEIRPDQALDTLLDLAKKEVSKKRLMPADAKEVPVSGTPSETWTME